MPARSIISCGLKADVNRSSSPSRADPSPTQAANRPGQSSSRPTPRVPRAASSRVSSDGAFPDGFDPPVREYLAYCRIECGFSEATLAAYRFDLRDLARHLAAQDLSNWGALTFERITAHLRELHAKGLAVSSIARHVAAIRVFTRWLEARGHLPDDPCEWLTQPATWRRLPNVLGVEAMRRLIEAPDEDEDPYAARDQALLEMLYASGLRASELAALTCDRLYLDVGLVRIMGKGRKERIVPVGRKALEAVIRYLRDLRPRLLRADKLTDVLFLSRTGSPLERVAIWQIVKKYARRAGLARVHPHTLRHSFATHLLVGGADLRIVQELLGHSNIQTTQVYTHVDRSHLKNVVAKHHPRP